MRSDEVQGAAELARLTLRGGATRVREVHQGIADRVFGVVGPVGRPVQLWHDAVAGPAPSRPGPHRCACLSPTQPRRDRRVPCGT